MMFWEEQVAISVSCVCALVYLHKAALFLVAGESKTSAGGSSTVVKTLGRSDTLEFCF
jgi:hypothetical protein